MAKHPPGHWEAMFRDYLDYYYCECEEPDLEGITIEQVIGELSNCTDILPAEYRLVLDLPQGSTYAKAVRKFKQEIAD